MAGNKDFKKDCLYDFKYSVQDPIEVIENKEFNFDVKPIVALKCSLQGNLYIIYIYLYSFFTVRLFLRENTAK